MGFNPRTYMTHSDPNGTVYITRQVMFNQLKHYIKEIQLIDHIPRPIKMISQSQPFQPIEIRTQIALKPESIIFAGNYEEEWEFCLN